jgi:hypothetical protein
MSSTHVAAPKRRRKTVLLGGVAAAAVALVPAVAASTADAGTLRLDTPVPSTSGTPGSAPVSGSWIRIQVPGTSTFLRNADSANTDDTTYTPLYPSTTGGGLTLGSYQAEANVATGSGIVRPVDWGGAPFDVYTQRVDPAGVKANAAVPQLRVNGDAVNDLRAWTIDYGNAGAGAFDYNQGADDSGGSPDGDLTVTRLAGRNHYRLAWSSQINGDPNVYSPPSSDPFNGLVGVWNIEGTL